MPKTQHLANSESEVHQIVDENECSLIMIEYLVSKVRQHKELMIASCKFCGNTFRNKVELEEHVKNEQYEATPLTINQNTENYPTQSQKT